jgi:NUBPL iron-transfer P-loop NTPase
MDGMEHLEQIMMTCHTSLAAFIATNFTVRKELNFCQKTKVPILGVVENMGQYTTTLTKLKFLSPDGKEDRTAEILKQLQESCPQALDTLVSATIYPPTGGGPKAMAEQYEVPYWGVLPMDPDLLQACESGKAFVDQCPNSMAAKALQSFCKNITTTLPVEEVEE